MQIMTPQQGQVYQMAQTPLEQQQLAELQRLQGIMRDAAPPPRNAADEEAERRRGAEMAAHRKAMRKNQGKGKKGNNKFKVELEAQGLSLQSGSKESQHGHSELGMQYGIEDDTASDVEHGMESVAATLQRWRPRWGCSSSAMARDTPAKRRAGRYWQPWARSAATRVADSATTAAGRG